MKTIGPSEEISRRIASPSVDLPEPDLPTTPSVSPWRNSMEMPSTALMWPTVLRIRPRLIGNQTLRSSVLITIGASAAAAPDRASVRRRAAPEYRGAAARRTRLDRAVLDDLAVLHHADPLRDLAHDAEVVGDEQKRHAEPRLDVFQQRDDLRLHGDVERRGRLVGNQQIGLVGERHGDHDALALAAGELVRIALQAGSADRGCRPGSALRACASRAARAGQAAMQPASRRSAFRSCAAD